MALFPFLKEFARTPLGIGVAVTSAVAGVVAGITLSTAAGVIVGIAGVVVATTAWLASGAAAKAVAADRERRRWIRDKEHLAEVRLAQRRLASLRLPDPQTKRVVELTALQAGRFLEACEAHRTRDPHGEAAIVESLELADLYLKELDDAAVERRFALPDDDPFADAGQRVRAALHERAQQIEKARFEIEGGVTRADLVSIQETL